MSINQSLATLATLLTPDGYGNVSLLNRPALGDNSTKLIDSGFLVQAFGGSLASTGYQKLPSGLIIQWGQANVATGASSPYYAAFNFPVSFPNVCYHCWATDTGSSCFSYGVNAISLTGGTVWGIYNNGVARWIAIGK